MLIAKALYPFWCKFISHVGKNLACCGQILEYKLNIEFGLLIKTF